MKNKILHNKINETMNNTTISDNQEKCYTSIDNIPQEILYKYIIKFLDNLGYDAMAIIEFIAEMKDIDSSSILLHYNLLMNTTSELFFAGAKGFYDVHIIEVMRFVCLLYYSEEFYMLATNLSINTSDIIEMHKLQNKVVDIVWFCIMDYIHTVLYEDDYEDWEEIIKTSPDDVDKQIIERAFRFDTLSFHFHAAEYDANFNNYIIKEES